MQKKSLCNPPGSQAPGRLLISRESCTRLECDFGWGVRFVSFVCFVCLFVPEVREIRSAE